MNRRFKTVMTAALFVLPGLLPGPARGAVVTAPGGWLIIDRAFMQMLSLPPERNPSNSAPDFAEAVARKHGLPAQLVKSIIRAESNGNSRAVSPRGAMGLMQLMPGTAREYGVSDPFDPLANVSGGVRYLKNLLSEFSGNLSLALAAYNAGPGAVRKYGGIPPYSETQNFVQRVKKGYAEADARNLPPEIRLKERGPMERLPEKIHITASPRALAAFLQKTGVEGQE